MSRFHPAPRLVEPWVRVLLNEQRDGRGRHVARQRVTPIYRPGDRLQDAGRYRLPKDCVGQAPPVVCAIVFDCLNAEPEQLAGPERQLARQWREAGHRALGVGDLLVLDTRVYACEITDFVWLPELSALSPAEPTNPSPSTPEETS